jgi:predicted nucleic acid-binding protein
MTIARSTALFFDASCLIAAAGSPTGGSGFLLSVCARGFLRALSSAPILLEAERNILAKRTTAVLQVHRQQIAATPIKLVSVPPESAVRRYRAEIEEDAHVVAAAIAAGLEFLLTLDRPLIRRVQQARYPIRALTPGEFIETVLPNHVDYTSIR